MEKTSNLSKIIYYLELFLFITIIIFSFFSNFRFFSIHGKTFNLSFYLSLIALPLFYFSYFFMFKPKFLNRLIVCIIVCFIPLAISSIGMSIFLYPTYNSFFKTNPTIVVTESLIKYIYDLSFIPYFIFFLCTAKYKIFKCSVYAFFALWVLFGLFQIFAFFINSDFLWNLYESIDFLKIIDTDSYFFHRIYLNYHFYRFAGFGSEPSSNATLICCVLLPFFVYEILHANKTKTLILNVLFALITFTFGILTFSVMVFFGLLVEAVALLLFAFESKKIPKKIKVFLACFIVTTLIIVFTVPIIRKTLIERNIGRIIDFNDYSTLYRYSTIWNDIKTFIKYPLFGVGDDNQGYFYLNNMVGTVFTSSPECLMAMQGEFGLLSGGPFIPSFISGFGLFGIVVVVFFINKFVKELKNEKLFNASIVRYFVVIMLCHFLFMTFSNNIHRSYSFFLACSLLTIGTRKNSQNNLGEFLATSSEPQLYYVYL